ncbi:cytochrome-ba3 oxidase subunit [Natronomonas marina]|jgi:hypothetical protein|uniref:cytochrome-ba3 oxidase subunit n=1 Tax=Natronomonas marina TaxID=2961939 RepID=UPI0020CA15AE|nr:cytochrome-ba3 oxidase subunit [Natronomonas marina]
MELTPRRGALVALLALVPVGVFAVASGEPVVAVALVNVLLIFGSLYVALSPVTGGGHGTAA